MLTYFFSLLDDSLGKSLRWLPLGHIERILCCGSTKP